MSLENLLWQIGLKLNEVKEIPVLVWDSVIKVKIL